MKIPEINEAIEIERDDGTRIVAVVDDVIERPNEPGMFLVWLQVTEDFKRGDKVCWIEGGGKIDSWVRQVSRDGDIIKIQMQALLGAQPSHD